MNVQEQFEKQEGGKLSSLRLAQEDTEIESNSPRNLRLINGLSSSRVPHLNLSQTHELP